MIIGGPMDKPTDQSATEPLVGAQTPLQHTSDRASGFHEALTILDDDGLLDGVVEVDRFGIKPEVYLEVFDHSYFGESRVESGLVALQPEAVRKLIALLTEATR